MLFCGPAFCLRKRLDLLFGVCGYFVVLDTSLGSLFLGRSFLGEDAARKTLSYF